MLLRGDSGTLKCPKIKYRILLDTIFSGRCGVIRTTAKKYWGAVSIGAWGQYSVSLVHTVPIGYELWQFIYIGGVGQSLKNFILTNSTE